MDLYHAYWKYEINDKCKESRNNIIVRFMILRITSCLHFTDRETIVFNC